MSVTAGTSHEPIGPHTAGQWPDCDSLMHAPTATLRSALFFGAYAAVAACEGDTEVEADESRG